MKTPKQFDRDLTKQLLFPTLSWSSVSAWEWDREEWYDQYVLGNRIVPNATMLAGIKIGQKLCTHPKFLPVVPRPSIYEHTLKVMLGKIQLTGHMDGWTAEELILDEYKTSTNPKRWTQKKVDNHGQLTFYCLLLWLNDGIKPEDIRIRLSAILTEEKGEKVVLSKDKIVKTFETKRTMVDLVKFMSYLEKVYNEMNEYVQKRKV